MKKDQKAEALQEWAEVLKEHPKFARAFLAQQAVLLEASELGYRLIARSRRPSGGSMTTFRLPKPTAAL